MDQAFSTNSSIRSYIPTQSNTQTSYSTTGQQSTPPPSSQPFNSHINYSHYMHQQVTTHPVPIPQKSAHANTFVHKLYK